MQDAIITHLFLLTQPGYVPLNLLSVSTTTQLFQKAGQLFLFKRGGNHFFHEAQE